MNQRTLESLGRINSGFYERHADAFAAKRSRPWPGWSRVLELFESSRRRRQADSPGGGHVATILDAGCGHGRFAAFLDESLAGPIDYLGVDSSAALVAAAGARLPDAGARRWSFDRADLLAKAPSPIDERGFDLIVALGLLHHIPGLAQRQGLLRRLAARLAPGGILALSFWQFGAEQRFERRVIAWEDHNRESHDPIDLGELEVGDRLLAWGPLHPEGGSATLPRRYCHYADPAEARQLVAGIGLEPIDEFRADGSNGALNLYFVCKR